jgi:hypothetical protein
MNDRRSFFKSLALLAAGAAVAPGIFVPKFEPVRWKVQSPTYTGFAVFKKYAVINPAWVNAPYEMALAFHPQALSTIPENLYPFRWSELDKDGKPISIPPYIIKEYQIE